MILGIDPGKCTGWAILAEGGELIRCGEGWPPSLEGVRRAVVECPQIYRASKAPGDPNDLIKVAILVGRYVERLDQANVPVRLVKPAEWKGQVPKKIHNARVKGALQTAELARLAKLELPESREHNVIDAIGLAKAFA